MHQIYRRAPISFFKISIKCGVLGGFTFPQNLHTRKLGEISVFCAVKEKSLHYDFLSLNKENIALRKKHATEREFKLKTFNSIFRIWCWLFLMLFERVHSFLGRLISYHMKRTILRLWVGLAFLFLLISQRRQSFWRCMIWCYVIG